MFNQKDIQVLKNLILITGGARSGKSAFAERLALAKGGPVVYLATMSSEVTDAETDQRIQEHRERRPRSWLTVEAPLQVGETIDKLPEETAVCLLDCLSLWISNILLSLCRDNLSLEANEAQISKAIERLYLSIKRQPAIQFIVVTNEVGSGVVPDNELARAFRDLLGSGNQYLAQAANEVWLSCVGLQLCLKPPAEQDRPK